MAHVPIYLHYDALQKVSGAALDALLLGYSPDTEAFGVVLLGILQINQ